MLTFDRRFPDLPVHLLLYVLGAVHWLAFINFGDIPFGLYDWKQEYLYLSVLKQSLVTGVFPLHVAPPIHFTDRYLASPLVVLAPHIILLKWVPLWFFEVLHILLFYSIGYLGAVSFKKKHGLSWGPFLMFFLLFNFNGYLSSHLAVGHVVWWTGYFLLPWFFLLILEWTEVGPSLRISLWLSVVVFGMTLSGSFHFFNWCLIFVWLMALWRLEWLKHAAMVTVVSAFLYAYRLVPAVAAFKSHWHVRSVGYTSPGDMWAALTSLRPPTYPTVNQLAWWEYDMWIGMPALVFLVCLGVLPLVPGLSRDRRFSKLGLPLAGMTALAYPAIYWWLQYGVPVLAGMLSFPYKNVAWWFEYVFPVMAIERVVSRMFVLSLVILAMLSSIRLEALRKFARGRRLIDYATAVVIALTAFGLARHSWIWSVKALAAMTPGAFLSPSSPVLVTMDEPVYAWSVYVGWAITLAAILATGTMLTMHQVQRSKEGRP